MTRCQFQVTTGNNDLQRWCVKLGRSPEEYLEQLCEAVLSEDNNVGVFEVQEDHLVWKQYFPDQDVYGKKGKFKLEKVLKAIISLPPLSHVNKLL